MQELWAEHVSCGTIDSISDVRASVTSMIQKHFNHTTVVEIEAGSPCTCLARGLSLAWVNFPFVVSTSIPEFPILI